MDPSGKLELIEFSAKDLRNIAIVKLHSQVYFRSNKYWVEKSSVKINFGSKKYWIYKNFWWRKLLGPRNFGFKKCPIWPIWLNQFQIDLTCPDLIWLNQNGHVLTWPTLTWTIPKWLVLEYPVLNSPVLTWNVLNWSVLTWPVLSWMDLSWLVL